VREFSALQKENKKTNRVTEDFERINCGFIMVDFFERSTFEIRKESEK